MRKQNKIPRKSHLPGLGIYFSRPKKHPFSGRKSTHFFSKATTSCGFIRHFSPKPQFGI
ncbi:hypothetical protein CLOBOL_07264 [Enterocloster bolteae ATCC BAA-613]|uniref:Uncharacterized protein n=1 Tax=Enterocloster bolteae (strain ATCC BAA-613 / DSM 15670 / CCUG 46953 / JCM 12243 / WAL 16351) TaxID=411902 RepID=A8S5N5_ENTBW|nr:hypothetical protein CLOBOL_07264 [Enterocloster bolteae ATCC BAA-613]